MWGRGSRTRATVSRVTYGSRASVTSVWGERSGCVCQRSVCGVGGHVPGQRYPASRTARELP